MLQDDRFSFLSSRCNIDFVQDEDSLLWHISPSPRLDQDGTIYHLICRKIGRDLQ